MKPIDGKKDGGQPAADIELKATKKQKKKLQKEQPEPSQVSLQADGPQPPPSLVL